MRCDCYILLVIPFFKLNGVEHACAIGHHDLTVWPKYTDACERLIEIRNKFEEEGYRLSFSGNGGEESPLAYYCRLDRYDGRAVVFKVIRKTIEGDLFTW